MAINNIFKFDDNDQAMEEMINKTNSTIDKIKEKEIFESRSTTQIMLEELEKQDFGEDMFEIFTEEAWNKKYAVDKLYYRQLLQVIPEEKYTEYVPGIEKLGNIVRELYDQMYIEPQIFGDVKTTVVNESVEEISRILAKPISSFMNTNYWELTNKEKAEKYTERAGKVIKESIGNNDLTNSDFAVLSEFSIKKVVVEDLLKEISFPAATWYRLHTLLNSDLYAKTFDRDILQSLTESFISTIDIFAKLVASHI